MNVAIHGAIRRDLGRFLDALERFRDGDRERASQLATAWANFDNQLTRHHEGEHDIAWPALEKVGVSKDVLAQMDAEHDRLAEALSAVRRQMAALKASASRADADTTREAMDRLKTVAVEHFAHEESEIEPIYQAKRDDPAIKAMGRQFAKAGPKEGGIFFAWVTDGAGPAEMQAITRDVPKPVLSIIGGIFGRPYRKGVAPVWRS